MLRNFDKFVRVTKAVGEFSNVDGEDVEKLHAFDERNIHPEIAKVSQRLFDDGHYSQSTFEAFKYLDKEVQRLSKTNLSGFKLMMGSFNEDNPKIELSDLTTESGKDEQKGYKFIFSGTTMAIRNPRGHEYAFIDTLDECLDHLSLASMLKRKLDTSMDQS